MDMNVSRTILGFACSLQSVSDGSVRCPPLLLDGVYKYLCNVTSLLRNCKSSHYKRATVGPCGIAPAVLRVTFRRQLWDPSHVVCLF
jgi:hypothetical protein